MPGESNLKLPFEGERPKLTLKQEQKLIRKAQKGDVDARNQLLRAHYLFVVKMARRYIGMGAPLPDLINEGILGLVEAINRADNSVGTRLLTFAHWPIRRYILEALDDRSLFRNVRPNSSLEGKSARDHRPPILSLDQHDPDSAGEDQTLGQVTEDRDCLPADEVLAEDDLMDRVSDICKLLRARDRRILQMRFGLTGKKAMTYREIGVKLKISQQRVIQIYNRAMKFVRRHISEDNA